MKYIQIYGARRSGTCYLQKILEVNFDCKILWTNKHIAHDDIRSQPHKSRLLKGYKDSADGNQGIPQPDYKDVCTAFDDKKILYLIIAKNPEAWLASMRRYRSVVTGQRVIKVRQTIITWNTLYKSWLGILEDQSIKSLFISYEHIICHEKDYVKYISEYFQLEQCKESYIVSDTTKHISGRRQYQTFDIEYYIKQQYLNDLSDKDKKEINTSTDQPLKTQLFSHNKESIICCK